MSARVHNRATPSSHMMKGFTAVGLAVGAMSGTSKPAHFAPSHSISLRLSSQALPLRSAEARLYRMRRLAGHENAHCEYNPASPGSALFRRAIMLPASVKQPV